MFRIEASRKSGRATTPLVAKPAARWLAGAALLACSVDDRAPDVSQTGTMEMLAPAQNGAAPALNPSGNAASPSPNANESAPAVNGTTPVTNPAPPSSGAPPSAMAPSAMPPSAPPGTGGTGNVAPPEEPTPPPPANLATLLWAIGSEGMGPSQFDDARSVGVDGSGNIYVSEYGGDGPARVQRFGSDGSFAGQWFVADDVVISGLVSNRGGTLHILQGGVVYQYDGQLGTKLGYLVKPDYSESPQAIALTPDNGLLTVAADQILRFDSQLGLVLNVQGTVEPALDNSFFLDGAATDGVGNIYVIATFEYGVYQFDAQGNFRDRIGIEGEGAGLFESSPESVAVDGRGRIYASDSDGIEVFEPTGASRGIIPASGAVFGMVVSDRNELIAIDRNEYKLIKYALSSD